MDPARTAAHDPFPRVSARARIVVTTRPAPPAPGLAERLVAIATDPWRVTSAAGVALLLIVVVAIMSTGVRSAADAASIPSASIASMIPAQRDRAVIGEDRDLGSALEHASIAPGDVDRILAETRRYATSMRFASGTPIDLVLSPRAASSSYREIEQMTLRPRLDTALDFRRVDGQLVATPRTIAIDSTPFRVVGRFGSDVRTTLAAYGLNQQAIDEYVRIIGAQMDIGEIARGDQFDIVVQQARAATGEVQTGALMYAGLYRQDGGQLRMSEWTLKGRLAWYDAEKASRSIDNVQRPVPGEVSSNFGNRYHPILHYTRMHQGVDFRAGYGTPILAVQTGWVERAGWSGSYGNQVELTHGGGISTSYSHMSSVNVRPGTLVRQGDVIGYVGATGLATGPHLHFEVLRGGQRIDPELVQFTVGPQLRGRDLDGYQRRLEALLSVPVRRTQPVKPGAA